MATLAKAGEYIGPKPYVHPENETYWKSLATGELKLQQCEACHTIRFPIGPACFKCGSTDADWVPVSPNGTVSAAIRIERATGNQVWAQVVPFIAAQVDMEGGQRMPGRVICHCEQALNHGTPVTAAYLDAGDGLGVLCFVHGC